MGEAKFTGPRGICETRSKRPRRIPADWRLSQAMRLSASIGPMPHSYRFGRCARIKGQHFGNLHAIRALFFPFV
jgi:hypothetical protein